MFPINPLDLLYKKNLELKGKQIIFDYDRAFYTLHIHPEKRKVTYLILLDECGLVKISIALRVIVIYE